VAHKLALDPPSNHDNKTPNPFNVRHANTLTIVETIIGMSI